MILLMSCLMMSWIEGSRAICPLECNDEHGFLCISKHLLRPSLERSLRTQIKRRFSVCHYDHETGISYKTNLDISATQLELERPSIAVTLIECSDEASWHHWNIVKGRRWKHRGGCLVDFSLLLILSNGTIHPYLYERHPRHIHTDPDYRVTLSRTYSLSSIGLLFDEIFYTMDHGNQEMIFQEPEFHTPVSPDTIQHWPPWAIMLVIVCVLLTILAFILGTCITKRATPLRKFNGTKAPATAHRRQWGAGFSGGLWAAA